MRPSATAAQMYALLLEAKNIAGSPQCKAAFMRYAVYLLYWCKSTNTAAVYLLYW
jgi:hypothetical protein